MARPRKIVVLDLEDEAAICRGRGKSAAVTCDYLNGLLEKRGSTERLTEKAVKRYWASLGEASVAVAHRPDIVERNAEATVDIASSIRLILAEVTALFEEAKADQNRHGERQWQAIATFVKQRTDTLALYVAMAEKAHSIESIRAYQHACVEALREVAPEAIPRFMECLQARGFHHHTDEAG